MKYPNSLRWVQADHLLTMSPVGRFSGKPLTFYYYLSLLWGSRLYIESFPEFFFQKSMLYVLWVQ